MIADDWLNHRRAVNVNITASMQARVCIIIPKDAPLLAIKVPNNERTELPPVDDREWVLRFDGTPAEGIEMGLEFSGTGPIQFLVVEEKTGLPPFPGLLTQPEPGTMKTSGGFYQGIPTDFTEIIRNFVVPKLVRK